MTTNETNHLAVATELAPNNPGPNNSGRAFSKRAIAIAAIVAVCAALAIVSSLHSRVKAETKLRASAQASAIPYVDVVSPKANADADEIALPGSTSAFNDTPIYARTSGYVKRWYVDIGARVRKGQLLATIETPELDQQLQQARPIWRMPRRISSWRQPRLRAGSICSSQIRFRIRKPSRLSAISTRNRLWSIPVKPTFNA